MKHRFFTVICIITCSLAVPNLSAIQFASPTLNYSINLPDDFSMTGSNGDNRYQFTSSILPVELLLCTYGKDKYKSSEEVLKDLIQQLYGSADTASFEWRTRDAAIAQISLAFDQYSVNSGWAAAVELAQNKGYVAVIGFYPESEPDASLCETLIISSIDSLTTDYGSNFEAGLFTSFAFPSEGVKDISIKIADRTINSYIDKIDEDANQYVIDREYTILVLENKYGLGQEACARFYKTVYRDAYKRLKNCAFAIQNELTFGENAITDRRELAETLLKWTQSFEYKRDLDGSDVTSLPASLTGKGCDCDSRSLLLAILLRQMNYRSAFFVSSAYSHALAGVELEGNGARMLINGTEYVIGETTADVHFGQIAKEMSNPSNWLGITFEPQK